MKKVYLVSVLLLIININFFSQPSFGFKLGFGVPNITVASDKNSSIDVSNKYGIDASLFAELPILKKLSIVSEIGYEQKYISSKITFSSEYYPAHSVNIDEKSEYLSYSLKAKYLILNGKVKPYCSLGVLVNTFLKSNLYGSSSDISSTITILTDEGFKRFNYFPVISAGCEFTASSSVIFLTELNFAFPVDSYFEYEPFSVTARTYALDFRIGLKF